MWLGHWVAQQKTTEKSITINRLRSTSEATWLKAASSRVNCWHFRMWCTLELRRATLSRFSSEFSGQLFFSVLRALTANDFQVLCTAPAPYHISFQRPPFTTIRVVGLLRNLSAEGSRWPVIQHLLTATISDRPQAWYDLPTSDGGNDSKFRWWTDGTERTDLNELQRPRRIGSPLTHSEQFILLLFALSLLIFCTCFTCLRRIRSEGSTAEPVQTYMATWPAHTRSVELLMKVKLDAMAALSNWIHKYHAERGRG